MTESPNTEQAWFWEDVAPGWLEAEQQTAEVSAPFGAAAIERLEPAAGQRVLDIGCGSGPTTIELARRVAPDGRVVGCDISPTLVAAARQRAADAAVSNATFTTADAQSDVFDGAPFDAVFSQFGVMFFADPVAAFTHARASMRPGGTLAFCCWQNLFANEWMFIPGSAVLTATGALPPMPGPDDPGPFSLAEPGRAESILTQAGFSNVVVESLDRTMAYPVDSIGKVSALARSVGPVREALRAAAGESLHQKIVEAVDEALLAKVADGVLSLNAAAFIVSATA